MKEITLSATINPNEKNKLEEAAYTEVLIDFPETVEEASELWGEDVCLSKIISAVKVDCQAFMRRKLTSGIPTDDIQSHIENVNFGNDAAPITAWAPGIAPERKTKSEKIAKYFDNMTEEEAIEYIRKLKSAE